jgi:hypothetical protein
LGRFLEAKLAVAVTSRGFWIRNFLIRFAALRQFSLDVRGKRYKKLTSA